MKILVVSAHYPPNFVSGGTLAPQRIAQGLRDLGHEVRVFAGWLGDRAPLESWTEVDETGLSVQWVVTTPWTAWNDDRNFDNPAVATIFESFLRLFRPDIVHFHSMQSLGAGLLGAAADAGIATVVTMHDFWWVCARQFLVGRDFRPCCPVVDAGVCPCEVDEVWLRKRNSWLRERLAGVDLVLAVSSASHRLLDANGVAADRLEVDENGLPSAAGATMAAPARDREDHDGPLRLLFAGGSDRMKGGHVLLNAIGRLERNGRWSLTAVGLRPLADELGFEEAGRDITWRDSYRPDEAAEVFGACDVVVVPSVMRESHSILTREALLHRRPVVVTDTFGPEEVVDDGRNGIIVPTGDVDALAAALRRLIDDRALVDQLTSSTGTVGIRPIADQVAGLDRRFLRLLAERQQATGRCTHLQRVLFLVGIEGAPLRYRARLPAEALELAGVATDVRHYRDPRAWRAAFEADAVVVYRVPATHQVLQLLDALGRHGTPRFFDVDDLIFDPELRDEIPALQILPPDEAELWMQGVRRYRTTMEACDAFIGSTEALCAHAEAVVGLPSFRFVNGVGIELSRVADTELRRDRAPGPFRFGYLSGTDTHDHDWRFIEPVVVRLLELHPDWELWLGGLLRTSPALDPYASRIRRLPLLPWWQLPSVLRDLDVNLAPLDPTGRFNEAKSAIKWLEAALVATPTIASPTQPFRESISHGRNGLLANGPGEWAALVERLAADPAQRAHLGARARRDAILDWSPHRQGRRYRDILMTTLPRQDRASGWEPLALDEPWAHDTVPLEPYAAPLPPMPDPQDEVPRQRQAPQRRHRVQAVFQRGLLSLRQDGVTLTLDRSLRWIGGQWPKLRRGLRDPCR